jgi:hypothetical protein
MRWASSAIGVALLLWAAPGAADARACIDANERGNELRWKSKLLAAREEYLRCSDQECPKVVREECSELYRKTAADVPTLVFAITDADGRDARDVTVFIDGSAVPGPVGISAVPVDPGAHRLRFEGSTGGAQDLSLTARPGEKNRLVRVQLARPRIGAPPEPAATDSSAPGARPVPVISYVLGGVGVAALGSFGLFAILGKVEEGCAPNCTADEVGSMRRNYVIADVSLGVAVLSLGAATVLYLTRPSTRPARAAPMVARF